MRNRPYGFEIYLVNVKTIRMIAQIFVAFSEKLNFTTCLIRLVNVVCERPSILLANKIPPSQEGLFRANSKKRSNFSFAV